MSDDKWDKCTACKHYRGEHDPSGCQCEIVDARGCYECPCWSFAAPEPPEEPDPTAALHARIATLEAQVEAAGMRWPQTVSTLEKALSTFPAGRIWLAAWDKSDARADAAQWQAFAMVWDIIGWMIVNAYSVADLLQDLDDEGRDLAHADRTLDETLTERDAALARAAAAERDREELRALLKCSGCDNPPTCHGVYEGGGVVGFCCDDCCGHNGEDGWCKPIDAARRATTTPAPAPKVSDAE